MSKDTYYKVVPFSRQKAEKALLSGDIKEIADALVGLAYYDGDWEYVRDLCMKLLEESADNEVKSRAAACLGHLARIHTPRDLRKIIPALKKLQSDPVIGWKIEDAIDEIRFFTKSKRH